MLWKSIFGVQAKTEEEHACVARKLVAVRKPVDRPITGTMEVLRSRAQCAEQQPKAQAHWLRTPEEGCAAILEVEVEVASVDKDMRANAIEQLISMGYDHQVENRSEGNSGPAS